MRVTWAYPEPRGCLYSAIPDIPLISAVLPKLFAKAITFRDFRFFHCLSSKLDWRDGRNPRLAQRNSVLSHNRTSLHNTRCILSGLRNRHSSRHLPPRRRDIPGNFNSNDYCPATIRLKSIWQRLGAALDCSSTRWRCNKSRGGWRNAMIDGRGKRLRYTRSTLAETIEKSVLFVQEVR